MAALVALLPGASALRGQGLQRETGRPASQLGAAKKAPASWQAALRARADFESASEGTHTRADYTEVMDGFREIYHGNPADPHAARAAIQVAELLGEQGREFDDRKSLRDAAGQFEFVARAYPGSSLAPVALSQALALLGPGAANDSAEARTVRAELLKQYPDSPAARAVRSGADVEAALPPPRGASTRTALDAHQATTNASPARTDTSPRQAYGEAAPSPVPAPTPSGAGELPTPAPIVRAEPAGSVPAGRSNAYAGSPDHGSSASGNSDLSGAHASLAAAPGPVTAVPGADSSSHTPGPLAVVTGIRHWSTSSYTRVAIDLSDDSEQGVKYQAARVENPDRIYFDLHHTKLTPQLEGKIFNVTDDGFLTKIRAARSSDDITRVVLDVHAVSEYSAFLLPNPNRLIIDIHGKAANRQEPGNAAETTPAVTPSPLSPPASPMGSSASAASRPGTSGATSAGESSGAVGTASALPPMPVTDGSTAFGLAPRSGPGSASLSQAGTTASAAQPVARPRVVVSSRPTPAKPVPNTVTVHSSESGAQFGTEVAAVSEQPGKVEATSRPTSQPIVSRTAGASRAPGASRAAAVSKTAGAANTAPHNPAVANSTGSSDVRPSNDTRESAAMDGSSTTLDTSGDHYHPPSRRAGTGNNTGSSAGKATGSDRGPAPTTSVSAAPAEAAPPTAAGETSMMRALGLKIGRIVIDAGHGGHDSGTLGAGGIEEKDVVLDVALRLGKLLHDRLGAEIVYTRADDTFIPLETRTAIANKAQADLFISVHANSSADATARGVEVYYLNFTSDPDAMRVAARENAVSTQSVHELSDLVKQIALKDKIDESRELASDVDASLFAGLTHGNAGLKNRGVKKAPFVVLIGANMPSILAEISFVTNPDDADKLERPAYRERVAESLYTGVARYEAAINGSTPHARTTEQARR